MIQPILALVLKTAGVVIAVAALLLLLVAVFQRRLIYLPLEHDVPPARSWFPDAEEVTITTDDGIDLGGWFVPAGYAPAKGAVLVLHGNAGNRSHRVPLARALSARGFATLLFDYRGYGGNRGRPTEAGLALDARAARRYLLSREDVESERLIYFGESLGAAVALELAVEDPPALLVLRSPFTSLTDIGRLHYPFLPVGWLLRDRYPSIQRAPRWRGPWLVVAGDRDGIVPLRQSRELFEAADSVDKRLVVIEGAGHNDEALLAGERMLDALEQFWCELKDCRPGEKR